MKPTLILCNANVCTMDDTQPVAQAVAIEDRRIVAVGSQSEVLALRVPASEVIDLAGRLLLPAFSDSHIHLAKYALARRTLDLSGVGSEDEAAQTVRARAAQKPPGAWIRGGGWDRNSWSNTAAPSKASLDREAPDNPVALDGKDLHSLWVNSQALAQAGIDSQTPDPPGGVIVRCPDGIEPSGLLLEKAAKLVSAVYPRPSVDQVADAFREVQPILWSRGIVGVHQMGDYRDSRAFKAFQSLHQRSALRLRVAYYLPMEGLDSAIQLGLRSGLGDSLLQVCGVKLFADGSLGSRTAWMLEPFSDDDQSCGVPWMTPEVLHGEISKAIQAGLAVAVHALGDRANREVIDAIAAIQDDVDSRPPSLRHRIEHVQLLHPADIARLGYCNITASMQPIHCTSDMDMADLHWGGPRSEGAFAWRSVLEAGAPLCFGSDSPVESFDVLAGIHAAVTRRRPSGYPGPEGWHPEQRLNVTEAVRAYTLGAAYAVGDEQQRGSITVGKLADLTVLSDDIFSCPPRSILQTDVQMTVFDGKVVHNTL